MQRLVEIVSALPQGFAERSWHGLSWIVVLAPLLLAARRERWIGAIVTLQLGFFLVVYWRAPVEPTFYVLSSWPRLVFQLWPATVVALFLALAANGPRAIRSSRTRPEDARESQPSS